jgi:hypothetical protein
MQTRYRNLFTTIRTEGAILPPDLLQRISSGDSDLDGLTSESYHLSGERLNEATNRSWSRIEGAWNAFKAVRDRLPENDLGTSVTRERWLLPLFQELGFGRLLTTHAIEIDGKTYPISHGWQNTPIHLLGFRVDLDKRATGVAGAARSSPHSLVQELLNRSDDHLWAFVSNGLRLRILRDNVSLTRQAYVEFDLEAMMDGEVYADFVLLWLLCHESRVEAEKPESCWLEKWSRTAQEQGTRALDQLRNGVEEAINALGSGFLTHPANGALRQKLQSGELDKQDYYRQLLRFVYRLLFLFVAEDRELLLDPNADEAAKERYTRFYSTTRIRQLAERRRGTRHGDLIYGLWLVMGKLGSEDGCPELGLPALGSFLFDRGSMPDLTGLEIANSHLLDAVRALAFITDGNKRRPVDYKNLRSEELGSIYEALLELHPEMNVGAGTFELRTAGGHERKTTGSYYTPDSLVQCLMDSALDPVLDEAVRKDDPESAILDLKVCDPATGSGHFLIAAAHRMARMLAFIRTGDEEPSPEATRKALRDVIGRCIYGVDINPMAVELCKVSLWMEALEPGKPLSFLDHRIQCGNSLLGTTPALLEQGIPDDAFKPIEGDDKKVCSEYRKRNKEEKRQTEMFTPDMQPWERLGDLAAGMIRLEDIPDDTIEGVRRKQERYQQHVQSTSYEFGRLWADAWCAAFVWKKTKEFPYPITEQVFRQIERSPYRVEKWMREEIKRLAEQYQFFHWHLAFPDVFRVTDKAKKPENEQTGWIGGFDVVLGNPPWDKIQPEEQKFFAGSRPDIANARTASVRKKMISELQAKDPITHRIWIGYKRIIEATSHLIKQGSFFPYAAVGNLNYYRLFGELASIIIGASGRAGLIVQTGMATDHTGREFFARQLSQGRLRKFIDFENRGNFFPDVHGQFRFALMTISGIEISTRGDSAEFAWLLGDLSELSEPGRTIHLKSDDLSLFNPSSGTCPTFKSQRDLLINQKMYRSGRHIYVSSDNRYGNVDFLGELFNMTRDSALFLDPMNTKQEGYLPLYEAKCIHQFDHRFAGQIGSEFIEYKSDVKGNPSFFMKPRSVVEQKEVERRATAREGLQDGWMCGFRSVSSPTNERTAIFAAFPFSAVGNSINLLLGLEPTEAIYLITNGNSLAFDYACREKLSGMNVNIWIMKQLPAIPIERYSELHGWCGCELSRWIMDRFLELSYTAWDLKPLAGDCDYYGSPFRWNEERRFLIRCELDAAYFHLYGIEQDDVDYIMGTFPIVKRKDEEKCGEYRTKRVILEIYDAMAEATQTGQPYETILSPPPADPSVSHPLLSNG